MSGSGDYRGHFHGRRSLPMPERNPVADAMALLRTNALRCADCGRVFDGPSGVEGERVCPDCSQWEPK